MHKPRLAPLLIGKIDLHVARQRVEIGAVEIGDLIKATEHLKLDTPVGSIAFRAIDHQSTMGVYIGKLAVRDGQGVMTDWRYVDDGAPRRREEEVKHVSTNFSSLAA